MWTILGCIAWAFARDGTRVCTVSSTNRAFVRTTVFALGVARRHLTVAAMGSMMGLVEQRRPFARRRCGWGCGGPRRRFAFGPGGPSGHPCERHCAGACRWFATVSLMPPCRSGEAMLFVLAAMLATAVRGSRNGS